ncbi:hypothetical protein EG329_009081 [Mollisiaceae sp. DMI_Dod_QoI]|nr:hypothetical protein EG329_009081 [Helotiales sp. DMI_Dod_QoI]
MAATQQSQPLTVVSTPFAQKYGPGPTSLYIKDNPYEIKSYLTPILPANPMNLRPAELQIRAETEAYQRRTLRGFPTSELIDLGVIKSDKLNLNPLDNPIDPIFSQSRWTETPLTSIYIPGHGMALWTAQNNIVWSALKPCLRLATHILSHINTHPWFDALLLGPRKYVENHRVTARTLLKGTLQEQRFRTFHLRDPGPDNARSCQVEKNSLLNLPQMQNLTFGIMSAYQNLADPKSPLATPQYAFTNHNPSLASPYIQIFIASELLQPLLTSKLNDGERLGARFLVAITLVHEMMHAFYAAKTYKEVPIQVIIKDALKDFREPYFMDEPVSELGFSGENVLFNGEFEPLKVKPFEGPHPGFDLAMFPKMKMSGRSILVDPPLPTIHTAIPVPVSFLESLFSKDFWRSMRSLADIRPGPVSAASYKLSSEDEEQWKILDDSYIAGALRPLPSAVAIDRLLGLNPAERTIRGKELRGLRVAELTRDFQGSEENVLTVMHQSEICERQQRTPEYNSSVELLLLHLDTLMKTQCDLVATVGLLEEQEEDMKGSMLKLYNRNREIRRVISRFQAYGSLTPDQSKRFQDYTFKLATMRLTLTSTDTKPLGTTDAEEQKEMNDSDDADDKLLNTLPALVRTIGDKALCLTNCEVLLNSLGCKVLTKSMARIMVGNVATNMSIGTRRELLMWGQRTLNTLTIPPSEEPKVQTYKEIATLTLQRLDEEEKKRPAGNVAVSCGHTRAPRTPVT